MNVEVYRELNDDGNELRIKIDGKQALNVYDDAFDTTDNNLQNNFYDCLYVPDLLRKAYEAGQRGEEFNIEYHEKGEVY